MKLVDRQYNTVHVLYCCTFGFLIISSCAFGAEPKKTIPPAWSALKNEKPEAVWKSIVGTSEKDPVQANKMLAYARQHNEAFALTMDEDEFQEAKELMQKRVELATYIQEMEKLGEQPLFLAINAGQIQTVKNLLDPKINTFHPFNIEQKKGSWRPEIGKAYFTPLIFSIYVERNEIAKELIALGADINFKPRQGDSAFIWAVTKGNIEFVDYLIRQGANIQEYYHRAMQVADSSELKSLIKRSLGVHEF